jgi:hypothetical protein
MWNCRRAECQFSISRPVGHCLIRVLLLNWLTSQAAGLADLPRFAKVARLVDLPYFAEVAEHLHLELVGY